MRRAALAILIGVSLAAPPPWPQAVAQEIEAAGGRALALAADVAVEADVTALFARCAAELGQPSALVNNAGVLETQTRLEQMSLERWQRVFATNVFGAFLCAREAVRRMSTRHGGSGGSIVNVSSGAARLGSPNEYIDYAASKGALDTLTVGLAKEVAEEGIRSLKEINAGKRKIVRKASAPPA